MAKQTRSKLPGLRLVQHASNLIDDGIKFEGDAKAIWALQQAYLFAASRSRGARGKKLLQIAEVLQRVYYHFHPAG